MREIKFRAWGHDYTTDKSTMCKPFDFRQYVTFNEAAQDRLYPFTGGDTIFMQYTGLKDKNGVEIYEGDIIEKIQWSRPYSKSAKSCLVRYVVEWATHEIPDNDFNNKALAEDPSCFNQEPGFHGRQIWNEKGYQHYSWSEFASCEVIGNIYENQELLENKEGN